MSSAVLKELMKEEIEAAYNDGKRRGEERGEERGKDAAQRKIILNMNNNKFTIQQISQALNMSTEDIEKIIQSESVLA